MLKVTNSVRVVFEPGTSEYLEKKKCEWKIISFDQFGMEIKILFENPIYISRADLVDIMKVSFHNT